MAIFAEDSPQKTKVKKSITLFIFAPSRHNIGTSLII
jgi:hypothetical protein